MLKKFNKNKESFELYKAQGNPPPPPPSSLWIQYTVTLIIIITNKGSHNQVELFVPYQGHLHPGQGHHEAEHQCKDDFEEAPPP